MICDFISLILNMICISFILFYFIFILLTGLLIIGIVCLIGMLQQTILNYFFKTLINICNIRILYTMISGCISKELEVAVRI